MFRQVNFGKITCQSLSLTSDRSKKKNIQKCEHALETIDKLEGVKWDWKLKDYGTSSGLIADELNEIEELKYMIEGEKGNYSIQYNCLHGYYIEAIKDLKSQVQELKKETKQLREELERREPSSTMLFAGKSYSEIV